MKAVEQQQPNSMDSSDSATGGSEYAYRPLTTKHRRAGSTGTTGDEEYTTDEDELYADEADCAGVSLHPPHPILKSDLARAATDLFGYSTKNENDDNEPTSLFDDDDGKFSTGSSGKNSSVCSYMENSSMPHIAMGKHEELVKNITRKTFSEINTVEIDGSGLGIPSFKRPTNLMLNTITKNIPEQSSEISEQNSPQKVASTTEILESQIDIEASGTVDVACPTRLIEEAAPPSPTTLHWEKAVAEVKEHAITKLQEELKRAHEELKLKDEEVTRLSRFRQDVETELEELTASLFQEAHNMVRVANTRQATAERLLEESRMKTEVLAAEVAALKTLVLTSTPAHPNPHLHPQIDTRCRSVSSDDNQSGLFTKKHRRSPSHFNLKYGRENSPPESPTKEQKTSLPSEIHFGKRDYDRSKEQWEKEGEKNSREKDQDKEIKDFGVEIDPRVHTEFLTWKCNPCVDKSNPFVARIFHEDIDLCLDFPNNELGSKVRQAALDGTVFIEAISDKSKLAFPKKCALLEVPRQCHYRMRLGDQENCWHCISQICRNRIIAVCDFLNYLRYVERGLVKSSVHDVYWEITRLRKEMVLARLGLALSS
ncbi:hypothetical protein PV326_003029 [Microctonus aethiopoides]|nr:hypothetical protein PV326_003029 [Microctonus aethiopoides]